VNLLGRTNCLHCCACLLIVIFDVPFDDLPSKLQFHPMQPSDAAAAAAFAVAAAVMSVALLLRQSTFKRQLCMRWFPL